jgi:hypothetical protein
MSQLYCICNEEEHGLMVQCEVQSCDIGWFHLKCINKTKRQIDKIDQYICEKCSLIENPHQEINTEKIINYVGGVRKI